MTTSGMTGGPRPDWYPDPFDPGLLRYWDGHRWTANTAPNPSAWGVAAPVRRIPWWQTWWAVVPGLLLCMPFGLVGLWKRPGLATWTRVGGTLATLALIVALQEISQFLGCDDIEPDRRFV